MTTYSATYSPEDNKLRLSASSRLDPDLYARVRAAGFIWAPQQGIFVAPMWTPERADLLMELCGDIGDEDTGLVERAEERAERFDGYRDNRQADAERARAAVARLADHIPLGQPILVGHHSERHARKDAARIENGMRKAVQLWDTAEYWKQRAAGALRSAKYKERPDVRARRIKTIEAAKRKAERELTASRPFLDLWQKLHEPNSITRKDGAATTLRDRALHLARIENTFHGLWSALERNEVTAEETQRKAIAAHERIQARCNRWIAHYENRLAYERAMQAESAGTATDKTGPEQGGAVRCWCSPAHGRGWSYIQKVNRVSVTVLDNWGNGGKNFRRVMPFDKLSHIMTARQVAEARAAGRIAELENGLGFMLRDGDPGTESDGPATVAVADAPAPCPAKNDAPANDRDAFDELRQQLKNGAQVVSVPQLFPTPYALATRMVELARLPMGARVLEPSAGTGAILQALPGVLPFPGNRQTACEVVAFEINPTLAEGLQQSGLAQTVICADFLDCGKVLEKFDAVLMNPPFANGDDIKHIIHALTMLKPGGRLVAICANGPRQQAALGPLVTQHGGTWEDLPAGTFKVSGTGVNTALITLTA